MSQETTYPQPESFEQAMGQLQQIVQRLEQGELPLDDALSAFKRGIELSQYCQKTLKNAEETVVKMMTDEGEVDFDAEAAK